MCSAVMLCLQLLCVGWYFSILDHKFPITWLIPSMIWNRIPIIRSYHYNQFFGSSSLLKTHISRRLGGNILPQNMMCPILHSPSVVDPVKGNHDNSFFFIDSRCYYVTMAYAYAMAMAMTYGYGYGYAIAGYAYAMPMAIAFFTRTKTDRTRHCEHKQLLVLLYSST